MNARHADEEEEKFLVKRNVSPPDDQLRHNMSNRKKNDGKYRDIVSDRFTISMDDNISTHKTDGTFKDSYESDQNHEKTYKSIERIKGTLPATNSMKPFLKTSEEDKTDTTSLSTNQIKKNSKDQKVESTGIITQLMGNGLKNTFVRNHNNMITIKEENLEMSPLHSRYKDNNLSPKGNVKIEELRLGYSADGKGLFTSNRNDLKSVLSYNLSSSTDKRLLRLVRWTLLKVIQSKIQYHLEYISITIDSRRRS